MTTLLYPMLPREHTDSEIARLQALRPLADEIAETVLAHIERERCIVKAQIARKIWFDLVGAATILWADPPGTGPKGNAHAQTKDQPGTSGTASSRGKARALTKDPPSTALT